MSQIKNLATGLIYRNPKPHLYSKHAYFPSVVVLENGEMLASLVVGSAFDSADRHVEIARSLDNGNTWTLEGRMHDTKMDYPFSEGCRIARMDDGELVSFGAFVNRSFHEEIVNPKTLGFSPTELVMFRSKDKGHSWKGPEKIKPPFFAHAFEICVPIVPLTDGRWSVATSVWKGWNGENPSGLKSVVFYSKDRGKTWPEYAVTMDGGNSVYHWEQRVVELSDGRLLAVAWVFDESTGKDKPNHYAISNEEGKAFSSPRSTGLIGQTMEICILEDGRILSVYRRMDKPGLWANIARFDDNDEWENLEEICLWKGARKVIEPIKDMAKEFNVLKFGAPCIVKLPDGDYFVAFWCVEDCVSNIRWFRLTIS